MKNNLDAGNYARELAALARKSLPVSVGLVIICIHDSQIAVETNITSELPRLGKFLQDNAMQLTTYNAHEKQPSPKKDRR